MRVDTKELDATTRRLLVELDADDLRRYVSKTERELAGRARIDGFRPGKVPPEKLRDYVGKDAILQQALSAAVQQSLDDAITQGSFDVFSVRDLHISENSAQRLAYEVSVLLYPAVILPDVACIKVPRLKVEVTDDDINETLETIRNYKAAFSQKDGPIAEGDRTEVDFSISCNGKIIPGGESKDHPLIVGGRSFMPGFEEQLIGMVAGAEKEFVLKVPKEYPRKEVAGKELEVKVKVNLVQTVKLPDLNDEFARAVGAFKDLAQLTSSIRDGVRREKEDKERERLRLEIIDAVIKMTTVKIPAAIAEEQLDAMMSGFDQQLHERGMELPIYLAQLGKTREQLRDDWRSNAERQAKIGLIVRAVGAKEGITVSDGEVEQELASAVQSLVIKQNVNPEQLDISKMRNEIRQHVLNEKILSFIEKRCAV